jgi:hypothetical protein
MYTQRGRLAQDDAAREIAKQRAIGSEHTWQPVQRDAEPRLTPESEGADDHEAVATTPPATRQKTARRVTPKARSPKAAAKSASAKGRRPARKAVLARSVVKSATPAKKKAGRKTSKARPARRR